MDEHMLLLMEMNGCAPAPPAAQIFGNAGREHMERFGTTAVQLAKIAHKNHLHSTRNPYSQFQDEYSLEQIQSAPMVFEPLTKLQCCPTSDGSAAAVLCSADLVTRHGLEGQAGRTACKATATDRQSRCTRPQ